MPNDSHNHPLNAEVRTVLYDDRLHGGVGGVQFDTFTHMNEAFNRGLIVDNRHDSLTVVSRLLLAHDYQITVQDAVLDHGVTLDPENKIIT